MQHSTRRVRNRIAIGAGIVAAVLGGGLAMSAAASASPSNSQQATQAPVIAGHGQVELSDIVVTRNGPTVSVSADWSLGDSAAGPGIIVVQYILGNMATSLATFYVSPNSSGRYLNALGVPGGATVMILTGSFISANSTARTMTTEFAAVVPDGATLPISNTGVPTPFATPVPTKTRTVDPTPVPTRIVPPTSTPTPVPTKPGVPTSTPTPMPTRTAAPTGTPTPVPTKTGVPTSSPTPVPTTTAVPTSTPTPTPTPAPTSTQRPTVPVVATTGPIVPGAAVDLSVSGFKPGEAVEVWLHSTPVYLGTSQADNQGGVAVRITIPADIDPGDHSIEFRGAQSGSVAVRITIDPPGTGKRDAGSGTAKPNRLAATGSDVALPFFGGVAVLIAGVASVIGGFRRRPVARLD